jgi:hypothetical protein
MEVVLECIKKYGPSAVLHQGGPVAVAGYKSAHARAHAGLFFFFSCRPVHAYTSAQSAPSLRR